MVLKKISDVKLTSFWRHKDVKSVIFVIFTLKFAVNDLFVPKYETKTEQITAYLIVNHMWIPKIWLFYL